MAHRNEFQASGTSPTKADFLVENHGSVFLHLPEDHLTFAGSVVVEHRYIIDILRGAIADGLVLR